jgi:hypothetical protein
MGKLRYMQTNGKLQNSSVYTYAFNLPAVETCPGAGICKEYCFALSEQKRYPSAMAYRQRSLDLSKSEEFIPTILNELDTLRQLHNKRGTPFAVRIHASGDFYSPAYIQKWITIIEMRPDIEFYAYTKSISMWEKLKRAHCVPPNLELIYSMGSNHDLAIDTDIHRHARIFQSEQDALDAGYTLASEDDTQAWSVANNKIGLVIFGATNKWKQAQQG